MSLKKIMILTASLMIICVSIGAISAAEWNFDFSSSSESSSDGGDFSLENGELNLQGVTFDIPDGFTENESARKIAEDAPNIENGKFSICSFTNDDGDEIVITVYFGDDGQGITNIEADEDDVIETIADAEGYFSENKYGDDTPTFRYILEDKVIEINAPNEKILTSLVDSSMEA